MTAALSSPCSRCSLDPRYNMHADDLDFQIEADLIGIMCPGLPQVSNPLRERVGRVI